MRIDAWVFGVVCPLVLLASRPVTAAQRVNPMPTIRSTSQEVLLEVLARDKSGRPVRNLEPNQFRIMEDGAPVPITGFRLVERKSGAADPESNGSVTRQEIGSAPFDSTRQVSLISLVFDRLGLDGRRLSRQAALDLIATASGANVYFAVFAVDQRLSVLRSFSNNLPQLRRAVIQATGGTPSQFAAQSDTIKATLQSMAIPPEHALLATAHAGAEGPAPTPSDGSAIAADRERAAMILSMLNFSEDAARSQQGWSSIFSLMSIAAEQEHYPGIKTIIYFSEGIQVPISHVQQFHSLIAAANRANVQVYAIDATGLTPAGRQDAARAELEKAMQSAGEEMDTRVSDHDREQKNAITPERVKSMERGEESIHANVQNSLAELAESTGGVLIANTNDARGLLRRVAADISMHYEITYVPRIQRYDGRFRKIAVQVTKPGVQIRTRDGYFALPPDSGPLLRSYETPLLLSLGETPAPNAFAFQSRVFHFGRAENGVECVVSVEVPLADIAFIQEKGNGHYQLHLSALDLIKNEEGVVMEKITKDVPFEGSINKLEAFRRGSFVWVEHRTLAPGHYMLETAVLDRDGERVSTRRVAFFVPAPTDGPTLSSLSLIRRVEPATETRDSGDPFLFSGGKVTPMLANMIPRGPESTVAMYFVLYPNRSITQTPELEIDLIHDGKLVSKNAPT
ncbi:MAG TPA: VWA domain-containing protein, partial [Bryobacteraceae bacterium]|nr:VWA domain-containing protein [Bryobacteraceae bacterium]